MPVDLTCIPERAENRPAPSIRRWLIMLMVLAIANGLIVAWLWPSGVSTRIPLFWICFPGGAILIWSMLIIFRFAIFLAPVFDNGGWNDARENDLALEILRGQRSVAMLAQVVQLPHLVGSGSLSGQLLLPDGIALPPDIDSVTQNIIHQARFNDSSLASIDRLQIRLQELLSDHLLQNALRRLPAQSSLTVALLTNHQELPTPELQQVTENLFREITGLSFPLSFIDGVGLEILDCWLDEWETTHPLLVLTVNQSEKDSDGMGEAAVALLLQQGERFIENAVVSVHRPELTHPEQGMGYALQQALLWGMTTPDDIRQIWLTGTGIENKADGLFSTAGVRFLEAGQPCDIDLRTGQTGCASAWLALAVAAENVVATSSPQLVMCVDAERQSPWFTVIRSPSNTD